MSGFLANTKAKSKMLQYAVLNAHRALGIIQSRHAVAEDYDFERRMQQHHERSKAMSEAYEQTHGAHQFASGLGTLSDELGSGKVVGMDAKAAEAKVKAAYPDAYAKEKKFRSGPVWCVFSLQAEALLGSAKNENTAWLSAASRMDAQEQAPKCTHVVTGDYCAACDYGMTPEQAVTHPLTSAQEQAPMTDDQAVKAVYSDAVLIQEGTSSFWCLVVVGKEARTIGRGNGYVAAWADARRRLPAQEQAGARAGGAEQAAERAKFAELNRALWPNNAGLSSLPEETIQSLQKLQRDLSAQQAECEGLRGEVHDLKRQMVWMHVSCEPDNCHTSGENCTGGAPVVLYCAALAQEAK